MNKIDRVFPDELIEKAKSLTWWEKVRLWFVPLKKEKIVQDELPHFLFVIEYKKMDDKIYILDTYTEYESHHIYNYYH